MRIIEGTPQEIVEYLRLTGGEEPVAGRDELEAVEPTGGMPWSGIEQLVRDRARSEEIAGRVLAYLQGALALGGVEIEPGSSERTKDGLSDYVMVRDDGVRRFGAVVYVKAINGGLTLRLTREDVADLADARIQFRDVRAGHQYVVNCPLRDEGMIDLALQLTKRALRKVRK